MTKHTLDEIRAACWLGRLSTLVQIAGNPGRWAHIEMLACCSCHSRPGSGCQSGASIPDTLAPLSLTHLYVPRLYSPPQSLCHCPAQQSLLTLSHTWWCLQREPAEQMAFRLEGTDVYDTSGRRTDRLYMAQPVFLWVKTFSRTRQTISL